MNIQIIKIIKLAIRNIRNHAKKKHVLIVSCTDLQHTIHLKEVANTLENWYVEKNIRLKWNWKNFDFRYTFKMFKKTS